MVKLKTKFSLGTLCNASIEHAGRSCKETSSDGEGLVPSIASKFDTGDDVSTSDAVLSELPIISENATFMLNCSDNFQPSYGSTSLINPEQAVHHDRPLLSVPVPGAPIPILVQTPTAQSEDMSGDYSINSARSQISPTTVSCKHAGEGTVAADDSRFVDILFQGTKIFSGKVVVEILIARHKRNRLLEMIVCADGGRIEVGHFYVRHEDLLSVVSQKDIHARLRLAVQSWTDGLPDIRSLLRCATTKVMIEYLLDHLDVSVEESHHGLTNLVAKFVPDEASGKQLPPMVLTEKPTQVPKLRWQPSNINMETIEESLECKERSLHLNSPPAKNNSWMRDGEDAKNNELVDLAVGEEHIDHAVVRVKPRRHTSMFSYFSPFSSESGKQRARASSAAEDAEAAHDEEEDGNVPVGMFRHLLNAMGVQSMRVLPIEAIPVRRNLELKRNMSMSTMSLSFGFSEVSVSSRSAPSAMSTPVE